MMPTITRPRLLCALAFLALLWWSGWLATLHGLLWWCSAVAAPLLTAFLMLALLNQGNALPERLLAMDWLKKLRVDDGALAAAFEAKRRAGPTVDAAALIEKVSARVIGQDGIVHQLAHGIARASRRPKPNKPVFSALFSGLTGTGKTELGKALAEALGVPLVAIDCGQLGAAGYYGLVGSPAGYLGHGGAGRLTGAVKAQPRCVVLFDEVEKVGKDPNSDLYKALLSVLDEARLMDNSTNEAVDFSQTIVLLTSNAEAAALARLAVDLADDPERLEDAAKKTLVGKPFTAEFLGRFGLVSTMAPLSDRARAAICAKLTFETAGLHRLRLDGVSPQFLAEAVEGWKAAGAADGVRGAARWIERQVDDGFGAAAEAGCKAVSVAWDEDTDRASVQPAEA